MKYKGLLVEIWKKRRTCTQWRTCSKEQPRFKIENHIGLMQNMKRMVLQNA